MSFEQGPPQEKMDTKRVLVAFGRSPEEGKEAFSRWYEQRQREVEQQPAVGRLMFSLECAELYLEIGDPEYAQELLLDLGEARDDVSVSEEDRHRIEQKRNELFGRIEGN